MSNITPGTNSVTPEKSGLGEQALNKMAEMALASQMEEVENLQVKVKVDPSNLAKGEVDSLAISGEGLVMHPDLRMAELQMQINSIAVKPLKALFGQIELVKPTDGTARIVLTAPDLDRAFNSEAISERLRQMVVHLDGEPVEIDSMQVVCNLLSDGIILKTEIVGCEGVSRLAFRSKPRISADRQGIVLQDIEYLEGKASPELTNALVEWASEILNLSNFELEGISLRIHQLNVEVGKLILLAEALVTQFPTS